MVSAEGTGGGLGRPPDAVAAARVPLPHLSGVPEDGQASGQAGDRRASAQADSRTPVIILTGFLGAGKTTVLQKMLAQENYGDTAVLINEFGEIGIDQQLIAPVSPNVVLLDSGCLCCQIRGELKDALADLLQRRARHEVPPFRRIVIETTGLAEPTPIIATLQADPMLVHQLRVAGTLTVIDAVNGERMAAENHPVWWQQVSAADMILVTKCDLAPEAAGRISRWLSRSLPGIGTIELGADDSLPDFRGLLPADPVSRVGHDPGSRAIMPDPVPGMSALTDNVRSLSLTARQPLDWTAFGVWLSALLHVHGRSVLRVKGFLDIGTEGHVLIDGVQHMIHPPRHLAPGQVDVRGSQLVFISRDLDPRRIEASFRRLVLGIL